MSTLDSHVGHTLVFALSIPEPLSHRIIILPETCRAELERRDLSSCAALFSANPRLDFIRAVTLLQKDSGFSCYDFESEIHPSVVCGEKVVIERGCRIGENVLLEHNVVIHSGTTIGSNSRIRANSCVVGDVQESSITAGNPSKHRRFIKNETA